MTTNRRRLRTWLVGMAAAGGVATGVVTAAGAAPWSRPSTGSNAAEALQLDQQVIALSQHEESLQASIQARRIAAEAAQQVTTTMVGPTVATPGATTPPATPPAPAETVPPVPAETVPPPKPGASAPAPSTPPGEVDPTPTSAPPKSTSPSPIPTSPTSPTSTVGTTTTTTSPRYGGGGDGNND